MRTFFKEFRTFAIRGNATEMMIGIVVGVGFKDLITSFVDNILLPPIGLLIDRTRFPDLYINLSGRGEYATLAEAREAGVPTLNYGLFISNLLDFVLIAFVVFLLVRQLNRLRKEDAKA